MSKKLCMEIPHIALIEGIVQQKKYEKQKIFSLCHSGNLSIERNPENIFRAIRELIDELNICMRFDIMGYANEFVLQLVSKYHLEKQFILLVHTLILKLWVYYKIMMCWFL